MGERLLAVIVRYLVKDNRFLAGHALRQVAHQHLLSAIGVQCLREQRVGTVDVENVELAVNLLVEVDALTAPKRHERKNTRRLSAGVFGISAPSWARTRDPLINSQML